MFTSVDSNRKKIVEHLPVKNVHGSPTQGNSFINKTKFIFSFSKTYKLNITNLKN